MRMRKLSSLSWFPFLLFFNLMVTGCFTTSPMRPPVVRLQVPADFAAGFREREVQKDDVVSGRGLPFTAGAPVSCYQGTGGRFRLTKLKITIGGSMFITDSAQMCYSYAPKPKTDTKLLSMSPWISSLRGRPSCTNLTLALRAIFVRDLNANISIGETASLS